MRMFTSLAIVLLVGPLAGSARADLSIDVSPIRIEVRAKPGSEYTDAVRVQNTGDEPVRLKAYVEDWTLSQAGMPLFRPAGTISRSATSWIAWAPADFLIEPGQAEYVRFTLDVPPDTRAGGFHGALILESLPFSQGEPQRRAMFIRGRMAVMLYVAIGNPRREARIVSLSPVVREEGPCLRLEIQNTGEDFVRLAGDVVYFVDDPEMPMTERAELPDVPVLPGSSRTVEIEIPRAGWRDDALARVTLDLDGIGQLIGECPLRLQVADSER